MKNTIEKILSLGKVVHLEKSERLFLAGDPANAFYYIESGEIRAYRTDEHGAEIEVKRFGPGNFIAEVILFSGETFPVSTEASKKTRLLCFKKQSVISAIEKDSSLALLFLRILSQKCIVLNERLEAMSLQNVRTRLVSYLLRECPDKAPYQFELKMKKTEIAKQLGTISETLSRNLKQLQNEKLVQVQGKTITILDLPGLKAQASL